MKNPVTRAYHMCRAIGKRYTEPLRLELSLVDHCNLNCKGCTHYCPIAPEHFMPIDQLERNLAHLSSVDKNMFKYIYLLGGEPLLHPHIADACRLAKLYFPKASLKLLTNGLRMLTMNSDFWNACRETGTIISVTTYPPPIKIDYEAIKKMCEANGVNYEIFHEPKDGYFFSKHTIDDANPSNKHLNFLHCYQIGCLTLRDNRIFPCSTSAYADLVNSKFERNFEQRAPIDGRHGGDYVEVAAVRSRRDLLRLKNMPTPFCRYCTKIEPSQWGLSQGDPSEWLP